MSLAMPSTRCLHSFLFLATALGLAPPIDNPSINLQPQSLSIINTSNAFAAVPLAPDSFNVSNTNNTLHFDDNVEFLNGSNDTPWCRGGRYGFNLNKESCIDAWGSIPTNHELVSYGLRVRGHFEAPLPVRFLSCKLPAKTLPSQRPTASFC